MGYLSAAYRLNLATFPKEMALALALAVGLVLRLPQLNGAMWYDEAFSAHLARLPFGQLLTATLNDVHQPAYYLLLWVWGWLVGYSPAALRAPSLFAGLFTVYLVYRLAKSLEMPQRARWLAVGLATLAPYQLYYSNEARFYALQTAALALAAVGILERRPWLFVAGSLAALYLHNFSSVFVATLLAAGIVWYHLRARPLIVAGYIVALAWLPAAGVTIFQLRAIHNNYWIPPIQSAGRPIAMLDDLLFMQPNSPYVIASGLATALALVLIVAAIPAALQSPGYGPMMLYFFFLPPLALAVIISLIWQPIMISRILAPLAPAYYLLLAWSVSLTGRRLAAWLCVAVPPLLAIGYAILAGQLGHTPTDWRYLSIYGQLEPTDGIFHANVGSYMTWQYYRPELDHYVLWQPDTDLDQTLTPETMAAMGIKQAIFDEVACNKPRWWLIQFNNPTSNQAEIDAVADITMRYDAHKIAVLRSDITVDAWLYRIEPNCERS